MAMTPPFFEWYRILRHNHRWTVLLPLRWALWLQRSDRKRTGAVCLAIALAIGSLGMSGCDESSGFALSIEPSYTSADLESDQALAGAWTTTGFETHLMRIGAFFFLDFLPNAEVEGGDFFKMHLFRAHSIARAELSQDTLRMAFFDATWLQKKIDEKSADVSYQKTDGMLLLTGTTEEVQNLLFLHGNDDTAFPDPITLARQEVQQ